MRKQGLTRALALAVTSVAIACAAVAFVGAAPAGAAEPAAATCTTDAALVRLLSPSPSCKVTVQCPVEAEAGCAFAAQISVRSFATVGTAQGRMRITDSDNPEASPAIFGCSAPAAIVALGSGAGCTSGPATTFMPAGRRFTVYCSWIGSTVSVSAVAKCTAAFEPLGGE